MLLLIVYFMCVTSITHLCNVNSLVQCQLTYEMSTHLCSVNSLAVGVPCCYDNMFCIVITLY